MSEWRWVQRVDTYIEQSSFLNENRLGAAVGEVVGGVAGGGAVVVGVLYVGAAAAPAMVAMEAAGATTVAAGGVGAVAYRAGHAVGKKNGRKVLFNTFKATITVGRLTGAFVGASGEHFLRRISR